MSEEARADPVHYSDWLSLLGFQDEQTALHHVKSQVPLSLTPEENLLEKIHAAETVVSRISGRLQAVPEIRDIAPEHQERLNILKNEETFQEHLVGMKSVRLALVELAKIHCFKPDLNLEYVNAILESAPEPDDLAGTIKFCLPTRDEKPKIRLLTAFNSNTNTFSAVTESLDFRILGVIQGEEPETRRKFAGFAYGFGLPQISVVNYKGVYMLKHGYHRAFALLKKGHTFMPCLLLDTDSYQHTGAQTSSGFFPVDLMMSDKSPILSDFNSEAAVVVPRRRVLLMATIHAEVMVVPV